MKALRSSGARAIECGRQHMLTRVLLHVFEAPRPVDHTVDGAGCDWPLDHVQNHTVVAIDDIDHARVPEPASVEWLSARRRIERSAVEHRGGPAADGVDLQ